MRRFYFILVLACLMLIPNLQPEANAQRDRRERVAKRRIAKTKVWKRTRARRRVRRIVTRKAHIRYVSLPRYGLQVTTVPTTAIVIKRSGLVFHYNNGVYYTPRAGKFVVVRPVRGVRIAALPAASVVVTASTGTYFYYYGAYYAKSGDEFEVVDAPVGAMVDGIPEGYEVVKKEGMEYYVWNNDYYQEVDTDKYSGGVGYEVVRFTDTHQLFVEEG